MTGRDLIPAQTGLIAKVAARYSIEAEKFASIIKQTAFKTKDREPSNEELAALLAVAERYGLDVWTKQIHAFVDKSGGIVPVVGVDGWNHLEQTHPHFAGERVDMPPREEWLQIDEDAKLCPPWVTVTIKRDDHGEQSVTEYLDECYKPAIKKNGQNGPYVISGPWQTHTKRMLRHKARIQAIREVLSYGGIYDADEAERIVEASYDYEAIAAEVIDDGVIIDDPQLVALLAEMGRTGLSEDAVRKNLEMKAGYSGPLCDMPLRIYEPLMAGLAKMPTNAEPQRQQESDEGAADAAPAPHTAEQATDTAAAPEEAPCATGEADAGELWSNEEPPGMDAEQAKAKHAAEAGGGVPPQQMRQLAVNWKKLEDAGWPERDLRAHMALITDGKTSRKHLTVAEASMVIKSLAAELQKLGAS